MGVDMDRQPATGNREPARIREPGTGNREPDLRQPAIGNRQPEIEYGVAADADASGFEENGSVTDYSDLDVWKVAMSLTTECYRVTRTFPADERFGLIAQIRRAAVSIPANIAEGYGRQSSGSYVQFLKISQGSVKELETLVEVSLRLDFLKSADQNALKAAARRVAMMLNRLITSIERSQK